MVNFLKIITIITSLLITSCTNPSLIKFEKTNKSFRQNNFSDLIKSIKEDKDGLYSSNDKVLKRIDLGILYHYKSEYDSSTMYLLKAQDLLEELHTKSITNETISLLTNDNLRPYRSHKYEQILIHLFIQFNYLALNEYDEALVEARKSQLLFDEWQNNNDKKYSGDGFLNFLSSLIYLIQDESDNAAISIYNSLIAYQKNKQRIPNEVKEIASYLFTKLNRYDDLKKFKLNGIKKSFNDQYIYIIGFGGRISHLDEVVLSGTYVKDGLLSISGKDKYGKSHRNIIPAPALTSNFKSKDKKTKSGQTFHIKVSLPTKTPNNSKTAFFTAKINDKIYESENCSNLDKLVSQNLKDNEISTLTRTTLRVLLRTITTESIKRKTKTKNPLVNLALSLVTDITSDQLEQADLRMGIFFPNEIHFLKIPVEPGKHNLFLKAKNNSGKTIKFEEINLSLKKSENKFIFFNSLR